jgi:hypothetical protein
MAERRLPPPRLVGTVDRDLRPVRPYLPPSVRALLLLPLGIVLLAGMSTLWGVRPNLPLLGSLGSWGLSVVQMLAGVAVVGLALREAVPGLELSRRALLALVAGAVLLFLSLTVTSEWLAPVALRPAWALEALGCFRMAARWGVPAFFVAALLILRASPTRPWIAGAACGLGVGLMVDAGMRIWCGVSTISHVLLGHGAGIVVLAVLGAVAGLALDRLRGRPRGAPVDAVPPPRSYAP